MENNYEMVSCLSSGQHTCVCVCLRVYPTEACEKRRDLSCSSEERRHHRSAGRQTDRQTAPVCSHRPSRSPPLPPPNGRVQPGGHNGSRSAHKSLTRCQKQLIKLGILINSPRASASTGPLPTSTGVACVCFTPDTACTNHR